VEREVEAKVVLEEVAMEALEEVRMEFHCKMSNHRKASSTHTLLTMELVAPRTILCTLHKIRNPCNAATHTLLTSQLALLHTILHNFLWLLARHVHLLVRNLILLQLRTTLHMLCNSYSAEIRICEAMKLAPFRTTLCILL
jgi:hypothetical protein